MSVDPPTDEEILAGLVFDHAVPCENQEHARTGDGAAIYYLHQITTCHNIAGEWFSCAGCWVAAGHEGLRCDCGRTYQRDEVWRIIRVIGGQP